MTDHAYIRVQYVNPRDGKRPPTIKDTSGISYTISDAALGWFQPGVEGDIGYYDKPGSQGGVFHIATEWNGEPLPRDQGQRMGGMQPAARAVPPVRRPAQPAPQSRGAPGISDIPPILSNVLAHAIQGGAKPEELPEWARWTAEAIKTFKNPAPPPPAPVYEGDPGPVGEEDYYE